MSDSRSLRNSIVIDTPNPYEKLFGYDVPKPYQVSRIPPRYPQVARLPTIA